LRGPLTRYRNHEADHAWLSPFAGRTLDQPALYIGGTRDPASTLFGQVADPVAMMRRFAPPGRRPYARRVRSLDAAGTPGRSHSPVARLAVTFGLITSLAALSRDQ
jgi:hypothetical protein